MKRLVVVLLAMSLLLIGGLSVHAQPGAEPDRLSATEDDLIFIHHSCGQNWLSNSLNDALLAKEYIDERNDIYYGTDLPPDSGRPDSLGPTPGDNTDMNHWILWFNDYLLGVKAHGAATGYNKIIMFKSCFPNSNISSDGVEPGDPFSSSKTLANYKAVYRHPDGPGNTYSRDGYTYKPLEDIFAEHPEVLFIPVTAPPLNYSSTTDANAHRARTFNNWLKYDWLDSYNKAHPDLHNVAVFDWFNVLTYPDTHPDHPNRLREEYGGATGDSHPNDAANSHSTDVFASNPTNFIDNAWAVYTGGSTLFLPSIAIAQLNSTTLRISWSHDWDVSWYRVWRGTEPYFIPSGPTPRALVDAAPWQYDDGGALGDASANHFYLVEDVLSDGILSVANRSGEFDFVLTPGGDTIWKASIEAPNFTVPTCGNLIPTDVDIAQIEGGFLLLTWTASPDVDHYEVHRSTEPHFDPESTTFLNTVPAETTQYTDSDMTGDPNNNYYYRVRSVDLIGCFVDSIGDAGEFDFGLTSGGS